jgi:phage terminase large subunit
MKFKSTVVFQDIHQAVEEDKRYIFLRGSSRSSKTISALQYIIIEALKTPKSSITIARATQVSIKNTILLDFIEVMESVDLWEQNRYNKVEMVYNFKNGSQIKLIGLDDSTGKLKGFKSDVILIDEVNTVDKSSFIQLDIRCSRYILALYNPEIPMDWWGLDYEKKKDGVMLYSNYKMNPFLDKRTVKAIEELIEVDEDMAKIYALGEIVEPREKIYKQPETYKDLPPNIKEKYYGIDFGFSNDECAVVEVNVDGRNLYVKQLIYEKGLTNQDLAFKLKEMDINRDINIVADSAEPKSIQELKREGLNVRPVEKTSILYGIQKLRQFRIFINEGSLDLQNEFSNYRFKKDRTGKITNTPTGSDHLLDALKYTVIQFLDKPKPEYHFL